jgi:hypothetical protein
MSCSFLRTFRTCLQSLCHVAAIISIEVSVALWLCAVISLTPSTIQAETKVICGTPFEVNEYARVDAHNSKVRIGSEVRILPDSRIESFVTEQFFKHTSFVSERGLEGVTKFITECISSNKVALALSASELLLHHEQGAEVLSSAIIPHARHSGNEGIVYLKGIALLDVRFSPRVLGSVLYRVALNDLSWLRTVGAKSFYRYQEELKQAGLDDVADTIQRKDYLKAARILALLREALSISEEDDDDVIREYENALARIEDARRLRHTAGVEVLLPLLQMAQKGEREQRALTPFLEESLSLIAANAYGEGAYAKALQILSLRGKPWSISHELVINILESAIREEKELRFSSQILAMLKMLSYKNPKIREKTVAYLSGYILGRFDEGYYEQADELFHYLLKLNPDPDRRNDAIRVKQAVHFAINGDRTRADYYVTRIFSGLSLTDRMRLLWAGYYYDFQWLAVAVFSPLLAAYIMIRFPSFTILGLLGVRLERVKKPRAASRVEDPQLQSSLRSTTSPEAAEYYTLLRKLGIPKDASLAEIKSAYRLAAKAAHPDAHPSKGDKASQEFIELNQAYERIVSLRKELLLDRDESLRKP